MLEGEISQINLIERLVELWREQFTGAIRFESDGIIKIIYFKSGDVLSASTNDRADSIDEILMRAGKVSREHVKQALARRKESETLGDAMLNLGYITRKELTWARRVQVVGVIRSIAAWTEGSFTIVADYLPKRDEGTLFPLPQLLVELIVTEQDRQKFDRALGSGAAVLAKTSEFEDVFRRLGLNEDAEAIVSQIDGTRSAAEVSSASGRDAFNVYKLLHALMTLGILRETGKPQGVSEVLVDDFATAGVADAADLWDDQPAFQSDETAALSQPTLQLPSTSFEQPPTITPPPGPWDMPDETAVVPAVVPMSSAMPEWSAPPEPDVAPVPAVFDPTRKTKEEQWGFDEAQIETAQRASTPAASTAGSSLPKKAKVKEGRRYGLLIALITIAILAAVAYGGFQWWQKQQQEPAPPVLVARKTAPQPAAEQPEAMVPVTETAIAPETLPLSTPASPATVLPPVEGVDALPLVRPRASGRTPLDDQAREYAANPQGKFTVQIQILCDPANVEKLVRSGGENVWFVPQTIGERACYRVFWGHYAARDEAQRALATVPAGVRDSSAAVKPVPLPKP